MSTTDPQALLSAPDADVSGPQSILRDAVYLTNEAARLLRVRPSTIRKAVRTGQLRGRGKPFRILGAELFKLL